MPDGVISSVHECSVVRVRDESEKLPFACVAGWHAGTRAPGDCILLSATLSDVLLHHSGTAEEPVFDLSAWGPNLLKLEQGCSASGAAGASSERVAEGVL